MELKSEFIEQGENDLKWGWFEVVSFNFEFWINSRVYLS